MESADSIARIDNTGRNRVSIVGVDFQSSKLKFMLYNPKRPDLHPQTRPFSWLTGMSVRRVIVSISPPDVTQTFLLIIFRSFSCILPACRPHLRQPFQTVTVHDPETGVRVHCSVPAPSDTPENLRSGLWSPA